MNTEIIKQQLTEAQSVLADFINNPENLSSIAQASELFAGTLLRGNKILSCGNGGSHCDAMHFAEELTGRYREDRKGFAAIAISDSSHITCVGNDFGYDNVFARYVEAVGFKGDAILGISTSGNSETVIRAFREAKAKGMTTVALSGKDGGALKQFADIEIRVPHLGYADRIQEVHIKVIHILILLIEKQMSSLK
ncbi:D-sedoheptulose 7-phosphate isomerase [Vibrio sp. SCSIO 43137]|uniref:D-sedoheptulose 7-phosphate isomerase n=1 Tax=Vibrio sp. SCSIO 43137 TaxID=3021011 RepID=UPI002307A8D7|nr:D-sedoheptulose 7-phosphate isomerase [Vibrio sp. SCSIO 43137]WCE31820.1 D-sedoheptulose 7-phosphate isomerase [Vibrio sp. SCSIO 43137]